MQEITLDREKAGKVKSYLLNNHLNCSFKALTTYIEYTETVFNVLGTNQKKMNFKNRKCYNHIFDVILAAIDYNTSTDNRELEKNIVIAILHDIGRGIEVVDMSSGTPTSQNLGHTAIGLKYLFDDSLGKPNIHNFLTEDFTDEQTKNEIRKGIEFHSTRTFPDDLPLSIKGLVKNIRFYDKMAIMDQYIEPQIDYIIDILNTTPEQFAEQEITDELLSYFHDRKCLNRTELHKHDAYNSMAQALSHIACIFDYSNDSRLFGHLETTNWVDRFTQRLPLEIMPVETQQRLAEIVDISKQYIKHKFPLTNYQNHIQEIL